MMAMLRILSMGITAREAVATTSGEGVKYGCEKPKGQPALIHAVASYELPPYSLTVLHGRLPEPVMLQ
jgi:hypothetical protein